MIRLTREQVREIDRRSIEEYHIPGIVLMENAARGVVEVAKQMMPGRHDVRCVIVCGRGNNGGDGFAVARHLHNLGWKIQVVKDDTFPKIASDAAVNLEIIERMKIPIGSDILVHDHLVFHETELVIDALFGTGLTTPPQHDPEVVIRAINSPNWPILSIDLPSGLDCDSGEPLGECVRATRTVTFVAEKAGFANPRSKEFTGEVTVADIGCPRELIEEVARRSG